MKSMGLLAGACRFAAVLSPILMVCACSALPPVDERTGAYDRQTSTGSNIPHKSSDAQSIGREGLDNVTRFGTNGAPTRGAGGN